MRTMGRGKTAPLSDDYFSSANRRTTRLSLPCWSRMETVKCAAGIEAGGDDFQIGLEMFETFTVRSALDFANAVAPYRPWFIEEPVEREKRTARPTTLDDSEPIGAR